MVNGGPLIFFFYINDRE